MISPKGPIFPLILILLGFAGQLKAQEKCGTVLYDKIRKEHNPRLENIQHFENWMRTSIPLYKGKGLKSGRTQSPTYIIPVVVHVIHNGESVGSGLNLSDAQIQSQIDVLNRDFPRLNADTVNTPSDFKPVAGSIDIKFVLAKQDPEGLPTNGIVRVHSTKAAWTLADNTTFKALSYWPAEDYLNIWVLRFEDPDGIIGYAQLPISSLAGLEDGSDDRLTDGVSIDYRAFGVGNPELFDEYNLGRTATHEIAHIFGLRHIWGDDNGSCSGTDYCDDTPNQGDSYNGYSDCSTPQTSCGTNNMFQNYMDYTNDVCMNLFSKNQIERMVVVLANSPRRNSLLSSPGATDPTQVANDLGIKRISSPTATTCTITDPAVVVRNYGSNSISSARIQLEVNNAVVETRDVTFSSLAYLDSSTVIFSPVSLATGTTNTFEFTILLTNGVADGKAANNSRIQFAVVPVQGSLPLLESFNATPADWTILNPDGATTWLNVTAPNGHAGNKAMAIHFYDYDSRGEVDQLLSPVFDLSTDTVAVLKFDRAYAAYSAGTLDQLRVLVFTGCNFTGTFEIFNKSGAALATVANSTSSFTPAGASDWKSETISLSQFLGESNVRIAFVATNDYGNNLYLDNARIITGSYSDLTLAAVKTPSPVTCVTNPTPVITVKNNGSDLITGVTVTTVVNGGGAHTQTFTGLEIDTGEEQDLTLADWSLNPGNNPITISLEIPEDAVPADNIVALNEVVNTAVQAVPLRENFDSNFPDWTIVSEGQQLKWVPTATNKKISIAYDAFESLAAGTKSWLVSPSLDFSKAVKGGLFFDLSYGKAASGNERLQVLSSIDCGQTFSTILFDQTGDQFKTKPDNVNISYLPHLDDEWSRPFINLDPLAGNKQARLAFVVTNDNGNNLYLDNIEIFVDDDTEHSSTTDLFSVYNNREAVFKILFNLPEKEQVRLQIYNTLGQVVLDNDLPDTLNQTYSIDLSGQGAGIYIVRLQMGGKLGTAKVFVPN